MLDDNLKIYNIDPVRLIDEMSSTEIYIGESINGSDQTKSIWKIKKIWQVSTVWHFGYPDGKQDYLYTWDNRFDYPYC